MTPSGRMPRRPALTGRDAALPAGRGGPLRLPRWAPEPAGLAVGVLLLCAALLVGVTALAAGRRPAAPLPPLPDWSAELDQDWAHLGLGAAGAGDVNGDGYDDLVAGAESYDGDQVDEGTAVLYLGSPAGLGAEPAWVAWGGQDYAYLGRSVAGAGDVDGDGYDDVLVGAHGYDGDEPDEGRAFLFRGTPDGLAAAPAWTFEGDQAYASLGWSVSGAGDLNGDGYGDVVVGAPFFDGGESDEGAAWVFYGSPAGLSPIPGWRGEGDQAGAFFGFSVAGGGDADGDGYDDLLVGAYGYDNPLEREGRATLFAGSASGLAPDPAWTAESGQAGSCFGLAVAGAGDLNGDGYDELAVGAYLYDHFSHDEGAVFVFFGSASGPSGLPDWTAYGGQESAFLGFAVGAAGDLDGDGFGDLAAGAHCYDEGEVDEGRAAVFRGSPGGLPELPDWTAGGEQANAHFGRPARSAGDVNGDGADDLLAGASGYDDGQTDEGAVFVYHGEASANLAVLAADAPDPVEAGQVLTYTITAGNGGPSRAAGPVLTTALPAGAALVEAAGPGWECGLGAGQVLCTRAELLPGESKPLTVAVTAPPSAGLVTATVQLSSQTSDPDPLDNSATLTTTVLCPPLTGVEIGWEPQPPLAGQPLTLTTPATSSLPLTLTWDLGDGSTASGRQVVHTYGAAGSYLVTLVASTACASATAAGELTVMAPAPSHRSFLPVVSHRAAPGVAGRESDAVHAVRRTQR